MTWQCPPCLMAVSLHPMHGEEIPLGHHPGRRQRGLGGRSLLRFAKSEREVLVTVAAMARHRLPVDVGATVELTLVVLHLLMTPCHGSFAADRATTIRGRR